MNRKILSVIVPAYNCESYLRECIDSILSQMDDSHELIVVDDGSTDHTKEVMETYAGNPLIRLIYCPHTGASGARNTGLEAASGKYAAFMDCDDCLQEGFLDDVRPLLEEQADLYIFGIERVYLNKEHEFWTVPNRRYSDVSSMADDYIREGRMLIYSNCNKFYRREIIESLHLRFEEGVEFGEDRLFNYQYLSGCDTVVTSQKVMLKYIQRREVSMSARSYPHYFETVMRLHRAKTDCFLSLCRTVSEAEKRQFRADDRISEIRRTLERFEAYPEEKEENLEAVSRMIFGNAAPADDWTADPVKRNAILEQYRQFLYADQTGGEHVSISYD